MLMLVAVVAVVTSGAHMAGAGISVVRDPQNDVRGRTVLDIATVEHGDGDSNGLLVHRLTTYGRWRPALLARGGEISFFFDTNGDAEFERRLDVRYSDGDLSAVMRDRKGRRVGTGHARQTGPRTVVVAFARSLLRTGIRRYRWFAFTGFRCHHRYKVCGDTTPRPGKWIARRLGVAPATVTVPTPIAGLGYSLVYNEQFASLSGWTDHIWYEPAPAAGAVSVSGGNLFLKARRTDGYANVTATTYGHRAFRRGYFEARMRWTKGNGAWPAFWMNSNLWVKHQCPPIAGEIDIFEGQGSEPTVHYGTLHRSVNDQCGIPDATNDGFNNVNIDLTAAFHTYSALWTQNEIVWYLDGQEVNRWPTYSSTDQDFFLLLQMWTGGWTHDPDASTPAELVTEVDWVRVWQRS